MISPRDSREYRSKHNVKKGFFFYKISNAICYLDDGRLNRSTDLWVYKVFHEK